MERFCINNTCTQFTLLKVQRETVPSSSVPGSTVSSSARDATTVKRSSRTFSCVLALPIFPSAPLVSRGIPIQSLKKTPQVCSEIFQLGTYFLKLINPKFLKTTFENSDMLVVCGSVSIADVFLLIQFIDVSKENLPGTLGSCVGSGWCSDRGFTPYLVNSWRSGRSPGAPWRWGLLVHEACGCCCCDNTGVAVQGSEVGTWGVCGGCSLLACLEL